jgi:circadian clock protein KaiC
MVLQRSSTGISGLDSLIEGGIPRGFTVLVAGNPGTGKTIMTSHFLYDGLNKGESGLYVSFGESKEQFYDNTERIGLDFKNFEDQNKFVFLDFASITKEGMRDALDEVLSTIKEIKAKRLVVDSFSAISQAYETLIDARIVLQTILGKIMRSEGVTSLLISEVPAGHNMIGTGIEEFVADGIIRLEHGKDNAIPTTLRVVKMRGTVVNREPHVCVISRKGMIVFPKQSLKLTYPASEKRIPSGISGLDEKVAGGILRGSTTAIMGATGVGKSTFAFQFIAEGIRNGEHGIFCSLEESADEIRRMAKNYGYDVGDLEKKGLRILSKNAEEQSPDAFIDELADEIRRTKAKRLAIDSITSFEQMYRDDIYLITKRLASLVREHEITTIFTVLTTQHGGLILSELGISSIFQNILLLRYVEVDGKMKRTMIILKMRSTQHDQSILEFTILASHRGDTNRGIKILGSIQGYVGILTGLAQRSYKEFVADERTIEKRQGKDKERRLADFEDAEREIGVKETRDRERRRADFDSERK